MEHADPAAAPTAPEPSNMATGEDFMDAEATEFDLEAELGEVILDDIGKEQAVDDDLFADAEDSSPAAGLGAQADAAAAAATAPEAAPTVQEAASTAPEAAAAAAQEAAAAAPEAAPTVLEAAATAQEAAATAQEAAATAQETAATVPVGAKSGDEQTDAAPTDPDLATAVDFDTEKKAPASLGSLAEDFPFGVPPPFSQPAAAASGPAADDDVPPPPQPFVAESSSAARIARGSADDDFSDESRFMIGPSGEKLLKWKVEYAARGGGGRAQCRDLDCLERHDQAGVRTIEKGALRIGRRVLMEKGGSAAEIVIFWHHARCMFNTFLRSRRGTRVIQSPNDIEGFSFLTLEDQELLRRFIDGSEDVRRARSSATGGRGGGSGLGQAQDTPEKRAAVREPEGASALKKSRPTYQDVKGRKGERVWTHCRVRPPDNAGALGPAAIGGGWVKSPKPELGLIVAEEDNGSLIVQFESTEHEKERLEAYNNPRLRSRRSWLRYPRLFEGKKQRLPRDWIRWNRTPPRLCSCVKQDWGHHCDCGISCGRGTSEKVWGVCQ